MTNKWLWLGQRLSDGLLFSKTLSGLDAFFSCDNIKGELPANININNLSDYQIPEKWTSSHIEYITQRYQNNIKMYLDNNYNILPYFLSSKSYDLLGSSFNDFNKCVFKNQLSRTIQMYLMHNAGINTPRWITPNNTSWEEIISSVGFPAIFQFNNSSSGLGTFCIKSQQAYNIFLQKFGEADIIVEYVENSIPCSAHLIIFKNNVIISSSSIQIIEKKISNFNNDIITFSFRGNDFYNFSNLNLIGTQEIMTILQKIGKIYQNAGVYGLIGIDFLIKENTFYYNETNYRFQNSTSLLSYLQEPGIGNIVNCLVTDQHLSSNIKTGFQYFYDTTVKNMKSGYYSTDGKFICDFYSSDKHIQDSMLIFVSDSCFNKNSLRIIGLGDCCDQYGQINRRWKKIIKNLENIYG
jgi:hypothetical protein